MDKIVGRVQENQILNYWVKRMKLTIYVAEDEVLNYKAILRILTEYEEYFTVIGQAKDGEKALTDVLELKPDILLTDIKMPIMDGLELIAAVRGSNLNTVPVIISGYSDFAFAREAIRLNVVDYLLKPVRKEELHVLLLQLYFDIMEQKKTLVTEYVRNILYSTEKSCEHKNIALKFECYQTIMFCVGTFYRFHKQSMLNAGEWWATLDLESKMKENIANYEGIDYWIVNTQKMNEKMVIIGGRKKDGEVIGRIMKSIYRQMKTSEIQITIVMGPQVSDLLELKQASQRIEVSLYSQIIYGKSAFICYQEKECVTSWSELSLDAFQNAIETFQEKAWIENIEKLLGKMCQENYLQKQLEQDLKSVFGLFDITKHKEKLSEIYRNIDEMILETGTYRELFEQLTYYSKLLFSELFSSAAEGVKGNIKKNKKEFIYAVEDYVSKNYMRNISLQQLAERFQISQSYLSYLYKKTQGITLMEYITNLRIEKAKKLLMEHKFLKDVAEMVGYEDPLYFSRVFKAATGMSPSEYKVQQLNGI